MNDLQESNIQCNIYLYANDIMIYYSHKKILKIQEIIQQDVNTISDWARKNMVFLNEQKTKMMWIKNPKVNKKITNTGLITTIHKEDCKVKSGDSCTCPRIEEVNSFKYLGIKWDNHLNYKEQINDLKRKMQFILIKFQHVNHLLPIQMKKLLYTALFKPVLTYGIVTHASASNYLTKKLEKLQNKMVKLITNNLDSKRELNERYRELNELPLKQLYYADILTSNYNNKEWDEFKKEYKYNIRINTRNIYRVKKAGNKYYNRLDEYLVPKLLNQIPQEIIQKTKFESFKILLKKHLIIKPIEI